MTQATNNDNNIILSCSKCGKDSLNAIVKLIDGLTVVFLICADERCREEQKELIVAIEKSEGKEVDEDFVPVLKSFVLSEEDAQGIIELLTGKQDEHERYN